MSEIAIRIEKYADVDWQRMEFLQTPEFKSITPESKEKLKHSLLNNDVIDLFKVWQDRKGKIWCLDGFHRALALKELIKDGHDIPEMLRAQFIKCKDKREAAKLVLIYSSQYAVITNEGLNQFIYDFNIDAKSFEIEFDIPNLNIKFPETNEISVPNEEINEEMKHECPKCHYRW